MVGCLSQFGGGEGSFPAQCAYRLATLVAHVGENSSPNCFLPQIRDLLPPCSTPHFNLDKKDNPPIMVGCLSSFGGGEGSRTPVQKSIPLRHSERRHLFAFPPASVKCQTIAFGSFQVMISAEANRYSRSPLIDARTEPWCSLIGRPPN